MKFLRYLFQKLSGIEKQREELHYKKDKFKKEMLQIQESAQRGKQEFEHIISVTERIAKVSGAIK